MVGNINLKKESIDLTKKSPVNLGKKPLKQNKFFSFLYGCAYRIYIIFLILLVGYCVYLTYNAIPEADNVVYSININTDGSIDVTETWDLSDSEEPVYNFSRSKWKIIENVSKFSDIVYTDVLINDVSVVQGNSGACDSYYVLSEHKVVPTDDDNFSTYINYNCTVYSESAIDVCVLKYTLKNVINGYEDGRYVFNFKLNDNKNYRINNYSITIENEGYSAEYKKYNPIFMSDGDMSIFVSAPDEIKINSVLTKWWWILSGNPVSFLLCTMIIVVLFIVCVLFCMLLNAVWERLFKKEIYPAILYIGCFILFVAVGIWFFNAIIFK